jgi:hypothetical protein
LVKILSSHGALLTRTHDLQNLVYCFFYFEAKNKTGVILPKVRQGSTKKPLNGAFLNEKLI